MTRRPRQLSSGIPTARRASSAAVEGQGLPSWHKGVAYDRDGNVVELRAVVYVDGVQIQCGPSGTPVANGGRHVKVRFQMSPSEARAVLKVLGRCVDASSAVVLEVDG